MSGTHPQVVSDVVNGYSVSDLIQAAYAACLHDQLNISDIHKKNAAQGIGFVMLNLSQLSTGRETCTEVTKTLN